MRNQRQQILFRIRLAEVVLDAQRGRVVAMLLRNARGDHDDGQVAQASVAADVAHQVEAVHARHFDVAQHQGRAFFCQALDGVEAVFGQHHSVAFALEQALGHAAHGEGVVDHQHQRRGDHRQTCRRQRSARLVVEQGGSRRGARAVAKQRGQGNGVVNQRHIARRQQSHAGQTGHARQLRAEVFHHHLLAANDLIDVQGDALLRAADDDDVLRAAARALARVLARLFAACMQLQQGTQPKELQHALAEWVVAAGIGCCHFGLVGASHHFHQSGRHGHHGVATAQHDHLRDGGGQRQHQFEGRALTAGGGGFNASADGVHIRAHHVHAHATTGQLGDFFGGGKPGREDEAGQLGVVAGRMRIQQTRGDGFVANARQVQPGAVVAEFHAHFVAVLRDQHRDRADSVFARSGANFGQLDAMGHAVAQQVFERCRHAVQHTAVDLNRAADDIESHLLAGLFGGLTYHAVQAVRQAFKLDHASGQQVVLQVARQARLGSQFVFGFFQGALYGALHGGHVVDRLGHHAGEFLEAGEAVELQRVEVLRCGLGGFQARAHLRFALQFDVAQLTSQTL